MNKRIHPIKKNMDQTVPVGLGWGSVLLTN